VNRDEAIARFKRLVTKHGLQWGPSVPAEAYAEMGEIAKVTTEQDRREALGLPR
jgi:hypothetical protein